LITSRPPQSLSQNEESSLEENHQLVYDKWLYNKYGYQSFSIDPDIVHYDRSFKEEM
ncbi:C1GALT1specific chaperone 1like, partial [Caligus rogercresseyi]